MVGQLQLLSFPVAPLAGWFSSEAFEPTTKCQNGVCQKLLEGTKVPFEEEARQTAAAKAHMGVNGCAESGLLLCWLCDHLCGGELSVKWSSAGLLNP